MKLIITDMAALRQAIASDALLAPTELPGVVTEEQLAECIASLETSADTRRPDSMAQVSPRALVHAIAVLKGVMK